MSATRDRLFGWPVVANEDCMRVQVARRLNRVPSRGREHRSRLRPPRY